MAWHKLQTLVYGILPSTTAVFSYIIGSRKLSANEQFFCWCSNSGRFVTNNSNYIRRLIYNWSCCLRQLKSNQNRLNRDRTLLLFSFFYPGWMRIMFTWLLGHLAATTVILAPKLQALVYDILPSTTAVFSYAIGSRKLSANEQFFWWCSNSSKFVTNNSDKTRRVIYGHQQSLHQHK